MRLGESMEGDEIDLDAIASYDRHQYNEEEETVCLFSGAAAIAVVNMSTLISCWIDAETKAYEEAMKG